MTKEIILDGKTVVYELQRKRVKNINLRIKPDGHITLSANNSVPQSVIDNFLISRSDLILSALKRYEEYAKNTPQPIEFTDGEHVTLLGKNFEIKIVEAKKDSVSLVDGKIQISLKDTQNKETAKKQFERYKQEKCKKIVSDICEYTYPAFSEFNIPYPTIHFRKMRTRWGSCNATKHSLNFNLMLIEAPIECIEYVVMHEFVHFLHPDHSKNFYNTLSFFMPDWKERKKLLEKR